MMMMMKEKFVQTYKEIVKTIANLSSANRAKVGAIIVKDNRIISIGYNGMPAGWTNECEIDGHSKLEVLHAETNAIAKVARSQESSENSALFCTHAPCLDCAKLIYQSGISEVYYITDYRDPAGVKFLDTAGIKIFQI
jgi:dCMP deaminase